MKQTVQKIENQGLGDFLAEDSLNPDVGKRVDKFGHTLLLW